MKIKFYTTLILILIFDTDFRAQDYLISFTGTGVTTNVGTVNVENLTQGTNLTMNGSDILHLMGAVTGIETISDITAGELVFYPNPMTDNAKMRFNLAETGETVIELCDISGREILQKKIFLSRGEHTFNISGVLEGIYFLRLTSGRYLYSGRLICSGSNIRNPKLGYDGSANKEYKEITSQKIIDTKAGNAETVMQYNYGDRLKFTGISDIYSSVIVDVPAESKTLTFHFFDCTDGDGNHYPVVKIGNQLWMAENLRYLPAVSTPAVGSLTDPFYYVNNYNGISVLEAKATTNYNTYGVLYNWPAAKAGCPSGWRLPGDSDWKVLEMNLGMTQTQADDSGARGSDQGTKMKNTTGWDNSGNGTNESGFSGLPGGSRALNGYFYYLGQRVHWWSSTDFSGAFAWYRHLASDGTTVTRLTTSKENGFSVRCIK